MGNFLKPAQIKFAYLQHKRKMSSKNINLLLANGKGLREFLKDDSTPYTSKWVDYKTHKEMELKQVPKVEKFLFTINLTRHMDDGTVEPTGVNFKLQISPNRTEEDMDVDIIRLLLSAVDSVASRSILTDKGPNYRHSLLDM